MNYDQEKEIFDQIKVIKSLILNEESDLWIEVENLEASLVTISNDNCRKSANEHGQIQSVIKILQSLQ